MPPLSRLPYPLAVAALLAGLAAVPAFAQGTAEQQEACTPDALKFCSASIPDIPKTTACMKAHVAQLSPRCRAAFADASGGAAAKAPVRAAREAKPATQPKVRLATRVERREAEEPRDTRPVRPIRRVPRATMSEKASVRPPEREAEAPRTAPPPSRLPGLDSYEARINLACRDGLIDPFTCRSTIQALGLLQ